MKRVLLLLVLGVVAIGAVYYWKYGTIPGAANKTKAPSKDKKRYFFAGVEVSEENYKSKIASGAKESDFVDPCEIREIDRFKQSDGVRVVTKPTTSTLPDPGPTVTLRIPPKPTNSLEAFYYKHTIGEVVRLTKEPKKHHQQAIDMLEKWCRMRAGGNVNLHEPLMLWKNVQQREPAADYAFEWCYAELVLDIDAAFNSGIQFTSNTLELERQGYSPFLQFASNVRCARELATYYWQQPYKLEEARSYLDKAMELLPKVLADPDITAGPLRSSVSDYVFVEKKLRARMKPGTPILSIHEKLKLLKPEFESNYRGQILVHEAWDARGDGFADTVTEEGWKVFHQKLKDARVELEKAWEQEPTEAIVCEILNVCMGQGKYDEHAMWYQRGIERWPFSIALRSSRLTVLCGKWSGSDSNAFNFARQELAAFKQNPDANPLVVKLLINAYRETNHQADLTKPEVYAELKAAYDLALKRHPEALEVWGWMASHAMIAKDYPTAIEAFAQQDKLGVPATTAFRNGRSRLEALEQAKAALSKTK